MLQATLRTITELLDSKKAAYSFIATILACVLHLYFGVAIQDAILLVSPLGLATAAQAHVDASMAKGASGSSGGSMTSGTDTSTSTSTVGGSSGSATVATPTPSVTITSDSSPPDPKIV